MGLRVERIPTLRDNYTYLLVCEESGEAAVVDAPEAEPVLRRVEASGARVTQVLQVGAHRVRVQVELGGDLGHAARAVHVAQPGQRGTHYSSIP